MKRFICFLLAVLCLSVPAFAENDGATGVDAPSAVLMEKESGQVLYEKDSHAKMAPASVTKVMTLLLIVEAIDRGDISLDDVVCASERAASFGGSCVFLEAGEQMSVHEMLKCITVVSANDCAVAMSEFLCGSEDAFVSRMNERASELGMKDTHFTNCTGLFDDDDHYTSAYDIAVMSRELIKHELIKDYSTIWMDTIRNGEFGLSSTNKLVYYYDGCTGLKTGFTSKAGYCLSATAEREGAEYIAVIMGGETSDKRNADAMALLNYAFANYRLCSLRSDKVLPPVKVELGTADSVQPVYDGPESTVISKIGTQDIKYSVELPETVPAPVSKGQQLGSLKITAGGDLICSVPLLADCDVPRAGLWNIFTKNCKLFIGIG